MFAIIKVPNSRKTVTNPSWLYLLGSSVKSFQATMIAAHCHKDSKVTRFIAQVDDWCTWADAG